MKKLRSVVAAACMIAWSACGADESDVGDTLRVEVGGGGAGAAGGSQGVGGSGGVVDPCGDAICDANETCTTCPGDCGSCCGDGACSEQELCSTCATDCGVCTGGAINVERGPYLQSGSDQAVTIRWRTNTPTPSAVAYGVSVDALTSVTQSANPVTEHIVRIDGLEPDTRYYYAIGAPASELVGLGDDSYTVLTAPPTGTARSTRIWAIGDSGTADAAAAAVRDAYLAHTGARGTDLWLMLGDNAYLNGTDNEYQAAVFDMYPTVLRSAVLWPTLGNHDGRSATSADEMGPYYDIFSLPRNAEAGGIPSGTQAYYAFDYGNIHFVCLDSYDSDTDPNGDMMTWLENDLSANSLEWLIAFWHHPPYTKGSHDSDTEGRLEDMRERALPILEAHGVDLVLTGHSHSYERSWFLNQHYGPSDTLDASMLIDDGDGRLEGDGAYARSPSSPDGAVYIVAGSSGKTTAAPLDHSAMFISLLELGSVVIDVDGLEMDVGFIDDAGVMQDWFTIVKM